MAVKSVQLSVSCLEGSVAVRVVAHVEVRDPRTKRSGVRAEEGGIGMDERVSAARAIDRR